MKIVKTISWLSKNALDLIFPVICLNCGTEGSYLCATCEAQMPRCRFQLCIICGKSSVQGITHEQCKTENTLDGLISAVPYKQPLARRMVENLKYGFVTDLAPILAKLIASEILKQKVEYNNFVLCPIPLHAKRLKWRGYNQAELIARELAKMLEIPVKTDLLSRTKYTTTQTELTDSEREQNVKKAFTANPAANALNIILVDDVATTGSTLGEACQALKSTGAQNIWAAVFAQG